MIRAAGVPPTAAACDKDAIAKTLTACAHVAAAATARAIAAAVAAAVKSTAATANALTTHENVQRIASCDRQITARVTASAAVVVGAPTADLGRPTLSAPDLKAQAARTFGHDEALDRARVLKRTHGRLAVIESALVVADVVVDLVAIVASFIARRAGLKVGSHHGVPAASRHARVAARVFVDVVTVVALLILIDAPVAAGAEAAQVVAAIVLNLISVITGLKANVHHAVTAARQLAVVPAGVGVDTVSVVAGFNARSQRTISTSSRCAVA